MRLGIAVFGLALGMGLGFLLGTAVWPVEFADVTPELLSAEQRVDYALMVATAYGADKDLELARFRLGRLGTQGEVALLNAFLVAKDDPAALAGLSELAAALGLHDTTRPESGSE